MEIMTTYGLFTAEFKRQAICHVSFEVTFHLVLVSITRDEDDLKLTRCTMIFIELFQNRREASAGWAPVSRKISNCNKIVHV